MKSDPERALGTIGVTEQTGLAVKHDDSNIKVRVFSSVTRIMYLAYNNTIK